MNFKLIYFKGDSGGPLYVREYFLNSDNMIDNKFVQIGIVSYGEGCGRAQSPGYIYINIFFNFFLIFKIFLNLRIYTKVSAYYDWMIKYL